MQISLDRGSDGSSSPVYQQIAAHFRAEIQAGRMGAGDRLPTIRALAERLRVNRDTVALAYEDLARAGLVESTVGRGTFVRASPPGAAVEAFEPALAPAVERLLDLEQTRPRYGALPGAVPLHALVPDPSLYPVDEFRRAIGRALAQGGRELLRYGGAPGYAALREVLAARLRTRASTSRSTASP